MFHMKHFSNSTHVSRETIMGQKNDKEIDGKDN